MNRIWVILIMALILSGFINNEINAQRGEETANLLELEFQRLAVRRFIFSQNIKLSEFVPSEIVAFTSMHPAFAVSADNNPVSDTTFVPKLKNGQLVFDAASNAASTAGKGEVGKSSRADKQEACFYVGNVNPYATYDVDIESISDSSEVGIDLARYGLRDRVQVLACNGQKKGIWLRIWQNAQIIKEQQFAAALPECPFKLRVQLYGRTLGVFTEKNGVTTYHDHLDEMVKESFHFGNVLDFRDVEVNRHCSFNVVVNVNNKNAGQSVRISGARSYLSAGIGQADIRAVSYEDLTPYMENGRLWFTFSMRGIGLPHPSQGVLSLDPSVFDVRFEGMIAFDFGDGLLRNSVAIHLFYDRNVKEWRAYSCDFGGSKNHEGGSESHLFTAHSSKDPRRGFSIMKASLITNERLTGHHEDPCIFYDSEAGKWRLLTSSFITNQIEARVFESDTWDGVFKEITPAIGRNSTGTVIQKIGDKYYCLMGGANENLRIHSYPDLQFLGFLNLDLQPHWPKPAGRVWAQVVELPEGYPYRYVLLTMDRPNFPGITKQTWSYGAIYFYGANAK
ncbi:MAG: hypothetical protein LBR84_05210 [Tannerella sp.]|nr:hypothetical protein [Tannerella sp.]